MMKLVLEQLHQEMGDKIRILKIDIDKSTAATNMYQVQSVPTLMLFQKGRSLWRHSGILHTAQLKTIIQQHTTNG